MKSLALNTKFNFASFLIKRKHDQFISHALKAANYLI